MERVFTNEELASPNDVGATGVSTGDLLQGVRYPRRTAPARSRSSYARRCNWVRFVDGTHFFARERREEIRLLG